MTPRHPVAFSFVIYLAKSKTIGPAEPIVNREQGNRASTAKPHKLLFFYLAKSKKIGHAEKIVNREQGNQASTAKRHKLLFFYLAKSKKIGHAERIVEPNGDFKVFWRMSQVVHHCVSEAHSHMNMMSNETRIHGKRPVNETYERRPVNEPYGKRPVNETCEKRPVNEPYEKRPIQETDLRQL